MLRVQWKTRDKVRLDHERLAYRHQGRDFR